MDIKGKTAVVTGGSRGVGRATALSLASQDCAVLVNYSSSKDEAEAVAEEARAFGVKAIAFQADVSDDASCRAMMDAAAKEFGRLDILVNNAGATEFIGHHNLEGVSDEAWNRILGVNLKGPFQCIRAAQKYMEAVGEGEVVNVASVAGVAAVGSCIPYCTSKAALINLGTALARALGPVIRINTVSPGFIAGDWLKAGLGKAYEPIKKAVEEKAVLGKVCGPQDIADAILSFITGSDLITAQNVIVDGGALIGPKLASRRPKD